VKPEAREIGEKEVREEKREENVLIIN